MKEKLINLLTALLLINCLALSAAIYFLNNQKSKLENDINYLKLTYFDLYNEVQIMQDKTKELSFDIEEATDHVDNIVFNLIGGKW